MAREQIVKQILNKHQVEANEIITETGSNLLKQAFAKKWNKLNHTSLTANANKDTITFDAEEIKGKINSWIEHLEDCRDDVIKKYMKVDVPFEERNKMSFMIDDIDYIQQVYRELKAEVDEVEMEFENTVRVYRSPLRQALNDITRLYNSVNNVKGDYSGFKNVSVYVHGIESNGKQFLESAKKAAQPGDVIMHEMRKGKNEYFVVKKGGGINKVEGFYKLKLETEFKNKEGRLHIVYDTEHKNEHRQETSDDVAKRLTEMGLVNEATKIDLFAHSYGGRRFFQFAMDYPDQVRSITTIGTPYDKNTMGKLGNNVPFYAGNGYRN